MHCMQAEHVFKIIVQDFELSPSIFCKVGFNVFEHIDM